MINADRLKQTFFELVKYDTGSDPEATSTPSTSKQLVLAKVLVEKLKTLGLLNVSLNEYGIVSGTLPANTKNKIKIGFIAHMDTSPDVATGPVKPQSHDYKRGDITLKNNVIITAEDLKKYKNHTILTSDGTTLLGADDKAGVAEILEMLQILKDNPSIKHPELKIAFTPDEEVGRGTENFDIKAFGADIAYTVDGSAPTDIDTETFNAFNPQITITGIPVHTGYAYHKMVSAIEIANQLMNELPVDETPAQTKDKEGYFHVLTISGSPEKVKMDMLVRDFNYSKAQKRIAFLHSICEDLERRYPKAEIEIKDNEKYHNMNEKFAAFPEMIELTKQAVKMTGLKPKETFVRGGTDGAELTLRGLLTPNLGAGGENFHALNEFVSLEVMTQCTQNLLNIIQVWNEQALQLTAKIKNISPCR
ncbi:MAG: peptidase T [Alphaproteobacteria bacterium]|nr:peptidase T [Alphaproteobacteria bacterium]